MKGTPMTAKEQGTQILIDRLRTVRQDAAIAQFWATLAGIGIQRPEDCGLSICTQAERNRQLR